MQKYTPINLICQDLLQRNNLDNAGFSVVGAVCPQRFCSFIVGMIGFAFQHLF